MKAFLLLPALALAAGCGGGSSGSGSSELRPTAVADKLGCSSTFTTESTEEVYVRELGKCTLSGAEVSLYTFTSNTNRDNWLKVAQGFGGRYVVLDRAIVTSDSSAAVDAAHAKAGGQLK